MEILDQLGTQSPKILFALVLCVLGWRLKRSRMPNWAIPWILIALGTAGFPFIAKFQNADYTAEMITTNALVGFLIGAASVGLHGTFKHTMPVLFSDNGNGEAHDKKPNP